MISLEWVNSTPWDTHRECSDEELLDKLEAEFARLETDDYSNVICNFHDPPYNSGLDVAPTLDEEHKVRKSGAQEILGPVGSKSVRDVIERYQPLLGMHGHIHESARLTGRWRDRLGRTEMFSAAHDGPELAIVSFDLENPGGAKRELV